MKSSWTAWTREEDLQLIKESLDGLSLIEIESNHGRNFQQIGGRVQTLIKKLKQEEDTGLKPETYNVLKRVNRRLVRQNIARIRISTSGPKKYIDLFVQDVFKSNWKEIGPEGYLLAPALQIFDGSFPGWIYSPGSRNPEQLKATFMRGYETSGRNYLLWIGDYEDVREELAKAAQFLVTGVLSSGALEKSIGKVFDGFFANYPEEKQLFEMVAADTQKNVAHMLHKSQSTVTRIMRATREMFSSPENSDVLAEYTAKAAMMYSHNKHVLPQSLVDRPEARRTLERLLQT